MHDDVCVSLSSHSLTEPRQQNRTVLLLLFTKKEPDVVMQALDQDACLTPPCGGIHVTSNWEEA